MTTGSVVLPVSSPKHKFQWIRRTSIAIALAVFASLILTIISVMQTTSQVGLGTMVSEKTLGRNGITTSSLLLGHTASNTELSVMGFAPIVYISTANNFSFNDETSATATLHGKVINMLGMSSATGYFVWGYSEAALTNTTDEIAITGVGDYSVNIANFETGKSIYYQFITDADGTAYGEVASFVIPSGVGNYILKNILRLIVAVLIILGVIQFGGDKPIPMLIMAVIGILGFVIINVILNLAI